MFEKLANGIPLHEAAAYFIKLKDFEKVADAAQVGSSSYAPPDETGQLEGQFTVPVEQVIAQMAKMVQNELKTQYAYMVYANSLRDLSHHAVANEFEDHAHNETEHADWLLRRMAVLGGPVQVPDIPAPHASTDASDILQTMVRMEQEGIENWRILRKMVGDENPSKFKVEEFLTREQEHLDELWQMMPQEANPAIMAQRAGSVPSTSLPPMPGMSEPDVNTQPKEPPAQGVKTAAAHIELCHPDTLRHHGEVMKLALMNGSTRGTTVVPDLGLDGVMKTAAARLRKAAEGMPPLPDTAMGKQQAATPPPALSGPAAGQVMKTAGPFIGLLGGAHGADTGSDVGGAFSGSAAGVMTNTLANLVGKANPTAGNIAHALELPASFLVGMAAGRGYSELKKKILKGKSEKTAEALFKRALSEMTVPTGSAQTPGVSDGFGTPPQEPPKPEEGAAQQQAPAPQLDPQTAAYLQQEQEGMKQEQAAQDNFYRQKFEQASQELQAAQQAQQMAQQTADQLTQSQQAMQEQQQAVQQAAMQNAQAAHAAATQAMQQSLSAQQETIAQQQLAVGMRDAVHAMRQTLMQQIQQQLPPATTSEANAAAIDQANAAAQPPTDMNGQQATGAQDKAGATNPQDNSSQPGAEGTQPTATTSGQPNSAPDAGTPMNAPSPGGAGPDNSPSSGGTAAPQMEGATPQGQRQQSGEQPPISVKVGSSEEQFLNVILSKTSTARGAAVGALGGAAVGALGHLAVEHGGNEGLRNKVQKLEAHDRAGGSFLSAMNLAQAKARLALGEFSENHPTAATAISAGIGAAHGAAAGHHLSQ